MNVSGKTKIYAKGFSDHTAYSRKISFKNQQGAWYNIYEPVNFKGGDPQLPNKCIIDVKEAFEAGYIDKDGQAQRKLIILSWELCEAPITDFVGVVAEGLPF